MACNSCVSDNPNNAISPGWRRALWIALIVNALMFAVELYAGAAADSHALKADALDFFGDAANYAISLLVAGLALTWRARAALLKGGTLVVLGAYVLAIAPVVELYRETDAAIETAEILLQRHRTLAAQR